MLCKKHPKAGTYHWSTISGDDEHYECKGCAEIRWGRDKKDPNDETIDQWVARGMPPGAWHRRGEVGGSDF